VSSDRLPTQASAAYQMIGHYEVVHKIATGGMGEVLLARQRGPSNFSRYVVLKRLHPKLTEDPQFVAMFLNEARIAANLSHPNIIHIYELFEDPPGSYVIAMEYVRGGTVLSLLRENKRAGKRGLPPGVVVRVATAVSEALHYAYFEPGPDGAPRRVIHRDVSPSNVIIGYDGHVKLVDFGIAKALEADAVTQATTLKGKYGYMSPEQLKSQSLDHGTDVFSLGTMLWEMFCGKRLFKRDTALQMLYAILEEPIPRPSERVATLPPAIDHIVMRALSRSKTDRYQDALEVAHDLRIVAHNHEWDYEASALSRLMRDTFPDERSPVLTDAGAGSQTTGRTSQPVPLPTTRITQVDRKIGESAGHSAGNEPPVLVASPGLVQEPNAESDEGGRMFPVLVLLLVIVASALFWITVLHA
jgi:eukaryotic-like serine/threonine-protein kinase